MELIIILVVGFVVGGVTGAGIHDYLDHHSYYKFRKKVFISSIGSFTAVALVVILIKTFN
jgi:uncharacterized membrane protein YedE/YeeE